MLVYVVSVSVFDSLWLYVAQTLQIKLLSSVRHVSQQRNNICGEHKQPVPFSKIIISIYVSMLCLVYVSVFHSLITNAIISSKNTSMVDRKQ